MPAWTEVLFKHLSKPQYKAVTAKELGEAYGTRPGSSIHKMVARVPEVKKELEKIGWHPTATRFLPMWLEFVFLALGEPKGIRQLKQSLDFKSHAIIKTRRINRR